MHTRRAPTFLAVLVGSSMLFGLPAAVAAQQAPTSPEAQNREQTPEMPVIDVVVHNNAWLDMHVYVVQSGLTESLGMVTGLSADTLMLPRTIAESGQDMRILADPIGGFGSYLSPTLLVDPGDEIDVDIENNLDLSQVTTRRVRD